MQQTVTLETGQKIVHSKYSTCHRIGEGSHAMVYSISLKKKGHIIMRAIKVQHDKVSYPQISTEISVLQCIEGTQNADLGFPKFFEYGFQGDYNYLVMQLLGPNLQQFMRLSGGKLSLKTVLILGLQMIDRIEVLHNAGFIYRDIKPENFVMGIENKSHILHMIDFGKCKRYRNKETGKHVPYKENCRFDCEYLFSSINAHNKTEYSRRDDIEALIYLMIYLRKGKLPWYSTKEFKSKKQRDTMIEEIKKKAPLQHLTYKMPLTFVDLLCYIRTLNYYQKPDYDYIRLLLHKGFSAQQDNLSMVFDWNKIDPLDFAIYGGQPKIVLRPETTRQSQSAGEQSANESNQPRQQQRNMVIKESNSLDMQVMLNKKASGKMEREDGVDEGGKGVKETEMEKKKSLTKKEEAAKGLSLFLGMQ